MTPADTARAFDAAVAVARGHGLDFRDPIVIDESANVIVHLRPAPVVARVATAVAAVREEGGSTALAREVAVASFLAGEGAPVVAPSAELPPGPHEHDGLWLTFWQHVEPDRSEPVEIEEAAELLRGLHEALTEYPDELPLLEPLLGELPRVLDALEASKGLAAEDIELLRAAHARLAPLLTESPDRPLHGDAHAGNLLRTHAGLLWTDFEDACRGPASWDFACLRFSASAFDPPGESLVPFLEARELQGVAWWALLALRDPARRTESEARLRSWRERQGR